MAHKISFWCSCRSVLPQARPKLSHTIGFIIIKRVKLESRTIVHVVELLRLSLAEMSWHGQNLSYSVPNNYNSSKTKSSELTIEKTLRKLCKSFHVKNILSLSSLSIFRFVWHFPNFRWTFSSTLSWSFMYWLVRWGWKRQANVVVNVSKSHKSLKNKKFFVFFFTTTFELFPFPLDVGAGSGSTAEINRRWKFNDTWLHLTSEMSRLIQPRDGSRNVIFSNFNCESLGLCF